MTVAAPLWLSEADVTALVSFEEAIAAVEWGLLAEAQGDAGNLVKTQVSWSQGHTLHALGATFGRAGFAGTKTWAHTAGGATPLLVLFDARNGSLRAIIEAFALGQLRTAAASAVATRWLAAPEADTLAIIGSGKQALPQVAAVAAVRPIRHVRVFSPNPEHRSAFAERLRSTFGLAVSEARSVGEAVVDVPLVTLVTRATAPVLFAHMLARGSHVNAVGAITPDRVEFAGDLFARCDRVVVDNLATVQLLSREFRERYGADKSSWTEVRSLAQLVASKEVRPAGADLTLFKAMGTGIADLSVAIRVYERAVRDGVGCPLAAPAPAALRWQPRKGST
ncbi:MAG TPA: ornithine cyclodeaminase family protein [Candidatus Limnocylindria bacterium]|jgi:ornithine cyclodeaminase|nr:ornithine cyclodeaminase family protein [Candidatus Limnocylindria bacterium]